MATTHGLIVMLKQPATVTADLGFPIGRIQKLQITASLDDGGLLRAVAIQHDPDKKSDRILHFIVREMVFTEKEQKVWVDIEDATSIPYGFYWDAKRGKIDRCYPQPDSQKVT